MKIELNLKDVNIEGEEGNYSYRINKVISVEGINTKEEALQSVVENLTPLIVKILRNRASIQQFETKGK